MRHFLVLSVFLLGTSLVCTVKIDFGITSNSRGDVQAYREGHYMSVFVKDGIQPGEQIRFFARRFSKPNPEAFDMVQIGYLYVDDKLEFSHGGGYFLPRYPFWFDRPNYLMSIRIIHWIYEKKIEVSRKLYNKTKFNAIGIFQEPKTFYYEQEGPYTEIIYVIGYPNQIVDQLHYIYVQGDVRYKFNDFKIPIDYFGRITSDTFTNAVSLQNAVEAYRSYIGEPSWYHIDRDVLLVESMGIPMPLHVTFAAGGFYRGQRAHFVGFFMSEVIVEIKTEHTTHTFYMHKNQVTFNNITQYISDDLYLDQIYDRIGSISIVNAGDSVVISYNIPNRFNIKRKHEIPQYESRSVKYNVKWDGLVTELILHNVAKESKILDDPTVDPVYDDITLLQHTLIDNEFRTDFMN